MCGRQAALQVALGSHRALLLHRGFLPLFSSHQWAHVTPCPCSKRSACHSWQPNLPGSRGCFHRHPGVWLLLLDASGWFRACPGPESLFGIVSPCRRLALLFLVPFETRRVKLGNFNKPSLNARKVQAFEVWSSDGKHSELVLNFPIIFSNLEANFGRGPT